MHSAALYRLMAWLSPSYPVGAFSYSHGLEWLVEDGTITNVESLTQILTDILLKGSGRNDAILFTHAHRAAMAEDISALTDLCTLASAFAASRERAMETEAQGEAFREITCRTWSSKSLESLKARYPGPISYPIAVATAAADHAITLQDALESYLHGFTANLISAGLRLVPLGHSDGQRALLRLEPIVADAVQEGLSTPLTALGGSAFLADMAAMKHETQYTRLFRS